MAACFTSDVKNYAAIPVDTKREGGMGEFEYIGTAKV
jgi:hypothetical protein